jgi:flagellar hook-associated protein 2
VREVATAINNDPKNAGQVSAGVVTVNGTAQLVLTSKNSGVANTIWVSSAGPVDPKTGAPLLDQNGNAIPAYNLGSRTEITTAQDAMIHYGGTAITNPSNTFNNIDGVSMTFTRAQSASEQPFTLKVAGDSNGTAGNVQAFIDAYNKLKSTVDAMVAPGDPASGMAAGAFAHDAGMQALQSSLVNLLRPTGTNSLATYGITATRDGTLSLDSTRLNKQLSVNPTGLDALIGSASLTTSTGVAGSLNSYLNLWSNSATGQLKQRSDATTTLQATLTQRQADLDTQYNSAYSRYLKQFTDLQTLQSTMNSNVSMFDALFGSKSN